jgi:nitrogen fixation-related uncharacterized protein
MIWAWMQYAWSTFRFKFLLIPEAIVVTLFFAPAIVIAFLWRLKYEKGYYDSLKGSRETGVNINFANDDYFYKQDKSGYSDRIKHIGWIFWLVILILYVIF